MRTWPVLVVLFAVIGAPAASADEQDPTDLARDLATRAFKIAGEGNLAEAVTLLKSAAALDPQPEYFCSAGNLYDQLDKLAQAHLWLSRCLAGGRMAARKPQEAKAYRKMYEKIGQSLRSTHAPVEISSSPSGASVIISAFEDDDVLITPGLVWLPTGSHTARLRRDGYDDKRVEIEVAGTESQKVDVELVTFTQPTVDGEPAPTPDAPPTTDPNPIVDAPDPTEPRDTPRSGRGKTPLILLGVGVASIATGGVFHLLASGTRKDLEDLPDGTERDDKLSTFNTQRGIAIGGHAAGAVDGGIGLYMMLRSPNKAKTVAVGPAPTGDGAMVWLSWRR